MVKKDQSVYQFKITLEEVGPTIWRRIQVPESYSFWDLHVAIQDAMGWQDSHLHEFTITNPKTELKDTIGIPTDDDWDYGVTVIPGWRIPIVFYFSGKNKKAAYKYDFGDCWNHKITLEEILPVKPDIKYPVCLDGARACPPEDCGGVRGYESLLEIIRNPKHVEYKESMAWLGGAFFPERFNPYSVRFTNPYVRLKMLLATN